MIIYISAKNNETKVCNMGKAFDIEIKNLSSTFYYASKESDQKIKEISNFICSSSEYPIILVGSGGSFSAAKAFEVMHTYSGMNNIAKAITPLDLYNHVNYMPRSSIVLMSANGNNSDILNAYKLTKYCNSPYSMIVCLNEKSKLKELSKESNTVFVGNRLTTGKDGYLAVNTLFATLVWLSKAYYKLLSCDFFKIPESFSDFQIDSLNHELLAKEYDSVIVLHSGITSPVAFDIESKFSEAALNNVMLVDYRNFAHGRHLWLENRGDTTLVIALVSPENLDLSTKTLSLIPDKVSMLKLETHSSGVKGMIELLLASFELVKQTGYGLGIDPGKPSVPEYGRRLYHYRYTPKIIQDYKKNDYLPISAILKKYSGGDHLISQLYKEHYSDFANKLSLTRFNQLVFDYDATLKESAVLYEVENNIFELINKFLSKDIHIAVATGRGKSARTELQERIDCTYWNDVTIGYYNGGEISTLDDIKSPNINIDVLSSLQEFANELDHYVPDIEYDLRPKQITVLKNIKIYKDIVFELAHKHKDLKTFLSEHSLDIVPKETSKANLINPDLKTLCIGDSGQCGGNDYELLLHEYSLSVNRTSLNFNSCWNLAPLGIMNSRATLYYLRCMELVDNSLMFKIK